MVSPLTEITMSLQTFSQPTSAGKGWTDDELTAAIRTYLIMLRAYLSGKPVNSVELCQRLGKSELSGRSFRSINLRMQNISAVFYDLRMPQVPEFPSAVNVGSNVKDRMRQILKDLRIDDLENYIASADLETLSRRVKGLLALPLAKPPAGTMAPENESYTSTRYVRDPAVKAWILSRAAGMCEGCGLPAPFKDQDDLPYLEVHHIVPLAKLGSDRVSNAAALCPNCHRRCHSSRDRDEFKLALYERIDRLQIEVPSIGHLETDLYIKMHDNNS